MGGETDPVGGSVDAEGSGATSKETQDGKTPTPGRKGKITREIRRLRSVSRDEMRWREERK